MNSQLQFFSNEQFGKIRMVEIDDKPYFVATDIAKALGYINTSKAIKDHCRWVTKRYIPHPQSKIKTLEVNVIPEGDMYRLITNSELPQAEKFESWVFDEVLPQIRKHGMYATDELLDNPDLLIKVATELKKEKEKRKRLEVENTQQKQIIGELKPKADYTDLILKNKGLVTITQIAKDYGLSGQALNDKLHELKVQYKIGEQWLLYSKYHSKGYTHSETIPITHSNGRHDVKMNTKWTQKGRIFIYGLLKQEGILPIIEREVA
ncbi:phage antirepressor [Clostridium butyricum]|uniref:phage antirepressor n=1 Tax=Clostridium butyricum TaxID=1492 RepID=UPI002ABE4285|nr:phage antirepressor KilAC domain-containing protein [Clostridium butyricum]